MKKRTALDLTEGPVLRKLMFFAVPLMINSAVQSLYSTADSIMVGQFVGSYAMAAVGASTAPINLLINLFLGLALGVNVVCANLKGIREATAALLCNLFGVIAPRLLWVWLVIPQMNTPTVIYAIYPISWAVSGVVTVAAFLYHRKKSSCSLHKMQAPNQTVGRFLLDFGLPS